MNLVESQSIHREGFISGVAYSISQLYQNYQYEVAENLLRDSELGIDDFKRANIPNFDLDTIKRLLK
jgi:hypothetical protein